MIEQDKKAWELGYQAGLEGKATTPPPPGVDGVAFYSGVIEGKADRSKPPEDRKPHTPPKAPKP